MTLCDFTCSCRMDNGYCGRPDGGYSCQYGHQSSGYVSAKQVYDYAVQIVAWWWLEQFANEKYPNISKQFIAEAKEAWAEEMIKRMNSGVFYGSGEEQK